MKRLVGLALALFFAAPAGAAPTIRAVQAGLGGYARPPGPLAVTVEIDNAGDPFEGELQVQGAGSAPTAVAVSLPGGARKRLSAFLPLPPALPYGNNQMIARLRAGRAVLAEQTAPVRVLGDGELVLGSCTTETGGLSFLNGMPSRGLGWQGRVPPGARGVGGSMSTAQLAPETMPRHAAEWNAVDVAVVTSDTWQRLEPEQRRAVRMWVQSGGRLLACGESAAAWDDAEGRLLLPVRAAGSVALVEVAGVRELGGKTLRLPAGRIVLAGGTVLPGAVVAVREGARPLLVSWANGFGSVTWLGLDPFRAGVRAWSGFAGFWQALLTRILSDPPAGGRARELDSIPTAMAGASIHPRLRAPSRPALAGFGLAYALIFGPVNVWVLRRLRRTVRAWLFVPALSLGMTGVLLAAGHAWGREHALLNRVMVVETVSGSHTGLEQELLGLFSPANRTFDFVSSDRTARLERLFTLDSSAATAPFEIVPTRQTDAGLQWEAVPFALWTLQPFKASRTVDLAGSVTVRLGADLAGEARNDTPYQLEECRLEQGPLRCDLGTLAPGARANISAGSWERRSRAEAAGDGGPLRSSEPLLADSFAAVRDEVGLMASISVVGEADEVILTCRLRDMVPGVRVTGLLDHDRASLLVVRVPVKVDAAAGAAGQRVPPSPFPRMVTPASPPAPGKVMAPPSPGL